MPAVQINACPESASARKFCSLSMSSRLTRCRSLTRWLTRSMTSAKSSMLTSIPSVVIRNAALRTYSVCWRSPVETCRCFSSSWSKARPSSFSNLSPSVAMAVFSSALRPRRIVVSVSDDHLSRVVVLSMNGMRALSSCPNGEFPLPSSSIMKRARSTATCAELSERRSLVSR